MAFDKEEEKMRLNKELAKKILSDVEEGGRFFCNDGKVFSNLDDLIEDLKSMDDEVFLHHAGQGRNDFSSWIRECLGDVRLADGLIGLDKKDALKKIGSRITYIEKYLEKNL